MKTMLKNRHTPIRSELEQCSDCGIVYGAHSKHACDGRSSPDGLAV